MVNIDYKELVKNLVSEFKISLSNSDEVLAKKLSENFEEYLWMLIQRWENPKSKFLERDSKEIELGLKEITKRFVGYDLEEKEKILIEDEKLKQIVSFSNQVYGMALSALNEQKQFIDVKEMEDKLDQVIKLADEVKPYNKDKAKELISEIILDVKFINDPSREIFSLRLAEKKRMKEEGRDKASNIINDEEER